ncbi:copper ion binding protein [Bacillus alkalicellulosilyticus]|uniref:copper ion binding protein n=1 Tax=Alkalihalobacterium alkalicellulosilyticum TaxID=1912214 RepID=UPI000995FBCC|nr:copper ion binding protein [Bacillus alkalicellulosilyticus]
MKTEVIKVEGMNCDHCVRAVEGGLTKIKGVDRALVSLADKQVSVEFDEAKVTVQQLESKIEDLGYDVLK